VDLPYYFVVSDCSDVIEGGVCAPGEKLETFIGFCSKQRFKTGEGIGCAIW
jgi:hypothetical protein